MNNNLREESNINFENYRVSYDDSNTDVIKPTRIDASENHKTYSRVELIDILGGFNKKTKNLTKYAEKNARLVYPYLSYLREISWKDGVTLIKNLSTHNSRALAMYGDSRTASRARNKLIELGILEVENKKFRFCPKYPSQNVCKTFKFYRDNCETVISIIKDYKISLKKNFITLSQI